MSSEVQKWADKAMFRAEPIDAQAGPQVKLLSCNNDPLGIIAAAAKMYEGQSVQSLAQITDDERRHYLGDVRKSALAAPLEFVNFHFIISGVTRGFTHQMVRQRTATYTQESTRFAVKEEVPVGLPPSLQNTMPWADWWESCGSNLFPILISELNDGQRKMIDDYAEQQATDAQTWRRAWDATTSTIDDNYNFLVSSGMPAEDARGLLPTNLLTRINYNTSLRGLLKHSGVRLCTQAQYEWRQVWDQILKAIREYGKTQSYMSNDVMEDNAFNRSSAQWQFDELSTVFKPICYQKGSCQFLSDVDRHCSIRDRVQEFAKHGIKSEHWGEDLPIWPKDGRHWSDAAQDPEVVLRGIDDNEWMQEGTARISQ